MNVVLFVILLLMKSYTWVIQVYVIKSWVTNCTCNRIQPTFVQNDCEHESKLRGALWKRLYDSQHAQIVAQKHSYTLRVRELCEEAFYSLFQDSCVPESQNIINESQSGKANPNVKHAQLNFPESILVMEASEQIKSVCPTHSEGKKTKCSLSCETEKIKAWLGNSGSYKCWFSHNSSKIR